MFNESLFNLIFIFLNSHLSFRTNENYDIEEIDNYTVASEDFSSTYITVFIEKNYSSNQTF